MRRRLVHCLQGLERFSWKFSNLERNVLRMAFDFFWILGTLNFSLEFSLDGVVVVVVVIVVVIVLVMIVDCEAL